MSDSSDKPKASRPPPAVPTKIGGDFVAGDKHVTQNAGGDIVQGDKNVTVLPPPMGVAALHQLRRPPDDFVGREDELDELRASVAGGSVGIFGLRGMGGIGKTALALKLAAELAGQYPDAQFDIDLRGAAEQAPLSADEVMARVIRAYHPIAALPEGPDALAPIYRSVLQGQRALILLDNARDAAQVKPLLPPAGCLLLVTSRQHFHVAGMRALNLDALTPTDAQALLLAITPRIGDLASALAEACACLPLALTLAGGALAETHNLTPGDYLHRLQTAQTRFEGVEASLQLSYALLSAEQQADWRALAVFPEDFEALAAAAVLALEGEAATERLGVLLRFSLLEYDDDSKRYRLHDLARPFAARQAAPAEHETAARRHSAHYVEVLDAADHAYRQGGDSILPALALFDLEWHNIRAGQAWAALRAEDDDAAALCSRYPGVGAYCLSLVTGRLSNPLRRRGSQKTTERRCRITENRVRVGGHSATGPSSANSIRRPGAMSNLVL